MMSHIISHSSLLKRMIFSYIQDKDPYLNPIVDLHKEGKDQHKVITALLAVIATLRWFLKMHLITIKVINLVNHHHLKTVILEISLYLKSIENCIKTSF